MPATLLLPPCTSVSDLERLAMNCRDDVDRRGRGRGLVLDAVSAAKLADLAAAFGVPAVDAALRDSGGTERPVAHAAAILEGKGRPPSAGTRKPRRAGSAPPTADPIAAAWASVKMPDIEELGEGE